MKDNKQLKPVGMLSGGKWEKMHDISRRVYDEDGVSPAIPTTGGGHHEVKVIVREATKKGYTEAGIYTRASEAFQRGPLPNKSRSIRAGCDDAGVIIIDGKRCVVRKLTPKECWRLFGFTDAQFETAKKALEEKHYKGRDKASSQLYKQAGNTIVIPMLAAVFLQIKGITAD